MCKACIVASLIRQVNSKVPPEVLKTIPRLLSPTVLQAVNTAAHIYRSPGAERM